MQPLNMQIRQYIIQYRSRFKVKGTQSMSDTETEPDLKLWCTAVHVAHDTVNGLQQAIVAALWFVYGSETKWSFY